MDGTQQNSRFLQIPREIRDEIYAYFIEARKQPPPNPSFPGKRIIRDAADIAHPANYSSWRYPNLVWVSRQVRNEYCELMEAYTKGGTIKAELDIMSKGFRFYPTWVFLPPDLLGESAFDLRVDLRIFSTEAYRWHDGWPRQPGVGFRSLLKLLNQLVHHGPSFGQHLELLRGKCLFAINKLSVYISFHEDYTPDTWPETAHNIFRMMKALARDGMAKDIIRKVHAHTEYEHRGQRVMYDREWDVSGDYDPVKVRKWREMGFLSHRQRRLRDDYRGGQEDMEVDFI